MSESHQYTLISISSRYNATERSAIGIELVELIKRRTEENIGAFGKPFPNYSKNYAKTLDFKLAGKRINDPNLELSGDLLRDLQVLGHGSGYIKIGFTQGSEENDKAAWVAEKRPFLSVTPAELSGVLSGYPIRDDVREQLGPSFFDSIATGILKGLFNEPK